MRSVSLLPAFVIATALTLGRAPLLAADDVRSLTQREEIARDSVRAAPQSFDARLRLTRILIERGQYDAAGTELKVATQLDPANPVIKDYAQALEIVRSPSRSDEERRAVIFALDRNRPPDQAPSAPAPQRAEQVAPESDSVLDQKYGISTFAFSEEETEPTSNRWKHILDLRSKRRYADALEFMRADVDEAPKAVSRRLDYIDLLMQVGNFREAGKVIKAGLEISPQHPLLRIAYDSLLRIAAAQNPAARRSAHLRYSMQLFEAREIRTRAARRSRKSQ